MRFVPIKRVSSKAPKPSIASGSDSSMPAQPCMEQGARSMETSGFSLLASRSSVKEIYGLLSEYGMILPQGITALG